MTAKELKDNIILRLEGLRDEDTWMENATDFFNKLIEDIEELYHKDMVQLKTDLDMYKYFQSDIVKSHKKISAGSWVYIDQDEGGALIWDEDTEYCYEIDYSIKPSDLFENLKNI